MEFINNLTELPVLVKSPLDQFIIKNLISVKGDLFGNLYMSITNMGLYLIITTFIIFVMYRAATNYNVSIPNT